MTDPLAAIEARHQAELDAREFAKTHVCTHGTFVGDVSGWRERFCSIDVRDESGALRMHIGSNCKRMEPEQQETQLHDDVGVLLAEVNRLRGLLISEKLANVGYCETCLGIQDPDDTPEECLRCAIRMSESLEKWLT